MRESLKIIVQAIHFIRDLEFNGNYDYISQNFKYSPPPRAYLKYSMESLIHHFKLYSEGFEIKREETYSVVEAPKGEFGVHLYSNGTNKPYRCRIKAPGFLHLQSLSELSKGLLLADLVTVIGTQDLVLGEIDR